MFTIRKIQPVEEIFYEDPFLEQEIGSAFQRPKIIFLELKEEMRVPWLFVINTYNITLSSSASIGIASVSRYRIGITMFSGLHHIAITSI